MLTELSLPPGLDGLLSRSSGPVAMRDAHRHAQLELNLVRAGRAAYLLGERRYELRRGTLVWLFPEQEHLLLEQSPDHAMWIGVFQPALLEQVVAVPGGDTLRAANPPGVFCRRLPEGDADWLDALFGHVAADLSTTPALGNAGLAYALRAAWDAYGRADDAPSGTDVHPAVERAARLVRDEVEPLSLDALAARVGLSAPHLSGLFARQTGMTLPRFRNRQRLERFLRAYGAGQRVTLLEAALDAGFGSYAQFHRVFRALMGVSPADYRRAKRRGIGGIDGEPIP